MAKYWVKIFSTLDFGASWAFFTYFAALSRIHFDECS
jgi:hypothetical protein